MSVLSTLLCVEAATDDPTARLATAGGSGGLISDASIALWRLEVHGSGSSGEATEGGKRHATADGSDAPEGCAELLERSGAVAKTRELALHHAQEAAEALEALPPSATRDALMVLCHKVVTGAPLK